MDNLSPGLRAVIDKHQGYSFKEVLFRDEIVVVFFYIMRKDDEGYLYIEDSFLTDLRGARCESLNVTSKEWDALGAMVKTPLAARKLKRVG